MSADLATDDRESATDAAGYSAGCRPDALDLEDLPCIAVIVEDGRIAAANGLAHRQTAAKDGMDLRELVPEICDTVASWPASHPVRVDTEVARRHTGPVLLSVSAKAVRWMGKRVHLLLFMEPVASAAAGWAADGSFLEDVLDATPEATVITHEGRVLHVNQEFSRLFGYSQAECVGQDLDELVIPDGRLHESEMVMHSLHTMGRAAIETVRRTRAGEPVDVSVLVSRVRLGGEAHGLFVTYRDIRKQKQEQARLRYTALHDALTGLPNRALFVDRLSLTMARLRRRPDRQFATIFLDLDGFKSVNDRLGHAAGDRLLVEIAARLVGCLRPQDTVARFGGDEFAMLLDESGGLEEIHRIAGRIQEEVQRPILLDGVAARVAASIGVALGTSEYTSGEEILRRADQAMYQAKSAGKARHVVFAHMAEEG